MTERMGPVLVTGASSGIGRAIVELLSSKGCSTFATARTRSDLDSLRKLPGVTPIRLDVTHAEEVDRVVASLRRSRVVLYGLVNNAGVTGIGPLVETPVEELHRVMDVNFYGMHRMVRACFPSLARSKGRIVNVSSINGIAPVAFFGAYCASKFAVEAYSDALRRELSGLGIRVSVVEPGAFRSDILSNFMVRRGAAPSGWFGRSARWAVARNEMGEYLDVEGEVDRSRYPDAGPVARAVLHALFSKVPKRRYLVGGNQSEVDWTLEHVLHVLNQLNQRQDHALTEETLVRRLRKVLEQ